MNGLKKEIRQALLGDLVPHDKRLAVSGKNIVMFRNGLRDGFGSVLFFGVISRRRWYYINKKTRDNEGHAVAAMQNMGRMLMLKEFSDGQAVYISYIFGIPNILTYRQEGDKVVVNAYAGKSFFGLISVVRSLNAFENAMSDDLTRFSKETEKKIKAEEKAREKEEKRSKKKKKRKEKVKEETEEEIKKTEEDINETEEAATEEVSTEETVTDKEDEAI